MEDMSQTDTEKKEERSKELFLIRSLISIERDFVRNVGVCHLCGDEEKTSIQDDVLIIWMKQRGEESGPPATRSGVEDALVLCNLCEGNLLSRLLSSYQKRKLKAHSKMGFKGKLLKEGEESAAAVIYDSEGKEKKNATGSN